MKQLDVVTGGVPQELLQDLISVRSKMTKRKRLVQLGNYLHYTCVWGIPFHTNIVSLHAYTEKSVSDSVP